MNINIETSLLECKNEIRLLKLCIHRTYKSYYAIVKSIKQSEETHNNNISHSLKNSNLNNSQLSQNDNYFIDEDIFPNIEDIKIPSYEENKKLDEIAKGYETLKEVYMKSFKNLYIK